MQVHDQFESIDAARQAIRAFVLDNSESFKVVASDKMRYLIRYKDHACSFRVRAYRSKGKGQTVSITKIKPHSCSPATHYNSRQSQSVDYLMSHHRAAVIDNRNITVAQIQSAERLQWSNKISYRQAYRTKKALLLEIDGDEAKSFAFIPAFCQRYQAACEGNYVKTAWSEGDSGKFRAIFIAPGGTRHAHRYMRMFIGLDGAHTKSKYRMQLLIAVGIDANNRTLLLAWALVPIENKEWWTWFCRNLCEAFDKVEEEGFVFISDREKGLIPAVEELFPQAVHAHCCNYIADNIASDYGNKCKPLFWKCAQAKTKEAFKIALAALSSYSLEAGRYVNNILHHAWARYAFPRPRFGHDASNINESINNA